MEEIFVNVNGFSGYQVSNKGRVKSYRQNKTTGKIINPQTDALGYKHVRLYKGNSEDVTLCKVHRLVAKAFLYEPVGVKNLVVHHKNAIKDDNRVENLEWTSQHRNQLEATVFVEGMGVIDKRHRPIICTQKDGTKAIYASSKHAAEAIGCSPLTVRKYAKKRAASEYYKQLYKFDYVGDRMNLQTIQDRFDNIEKYLKEYADRLA